MLQDRLPVKFQDVKYTVPKCKHEIFVRIDMKHSYFSNYFIICCNQFFSVVEIMFVCLKLKLICLCIIFVLIEILTLYMYLCTCS